MELNGEGSAIAEEHASAIAKYIQDEITLTSNRTALGISELLGNKSPAIDYEIGKRIYAQSAWVVDNVWSMLKMDWMNNDNLSLELLRTQLNKTPNTQLKETPKMTTQLFGAIKETRDVAIAHYKSDKTDEQLKEEIQGMGADEIIKHFADGREQRAVEAIDKAIAGTLDAVEEHYEEIVQASTEHEESPDVTITITSGLSDSYFESVNN